MRKRSGGIHCDSIQALLQLSEISHQQVGIYYNGRIKTYFSDQSQQKDASFFSKRNQDYFQGFQYSFEVREKEEEQKDFSTQISKIAKHFTVICSSISLFFFQNSQSFKARFNSNLNLELLTKEGRDLICKYWFIQKKALQGRSNQYISKNILETYLKCSDAIYVWNSNQDVKEFTSFAAYKEGLNQQTCNLFQPLD